MNALTDTTILADGYASTPGASVGVELLREAPLSEVNFGFQGPELWKLGWSVCPQSRDGDKRMPSKIWGEVIKFGEQGYDLANKRVDADTLLTWSRHAACDNTAVVFGPASDNTFAVDIDITDEDFSAQVELLADDLLGVTPFKRIGKRPKIALIYRHAPGDIVPTVQRRFERTDEDGDAHMLEIKSTGTLFTFLGRHHSTGDTFRWKGTYRDGVDNHAIPLIHGPERALLVTSAQVQAFLETVNARWAFAKSFSAALKAGGQGWTDGNADGIRLPKVGEVADAKRDGLGRLADGRGAYLGSYVIRTIRGNPEGLWAAVDAGDEAALKDYKENVAAAVLEHVRAAFAPDSKWPTAGMRRKVQEEVGRTVDRARAGAVQVSRQPPQAVRQAKAEDVWAAYEARRAALPLVQILPGDTAAIVDQVEDALIAAEVGLYQRSGRVVKVSVEKVRTAKAGEVPGQRIVELDEYALKERATSAARYETWDARQKGFKPADLAMEYVKTLQSRGFDLRLPVLDGILNAPLLREDGSVLDRPGYDAATGYYYDPTSQRFPAIPANPTMQDAQRARDTLASLLGGFPFVGPVDRSVTLATFLSGVVRKSLTTCPMFGFDAKSPGSGKSKLCDMASALATGREAGAVSATDSAEKLEKELGSLYMKGEPVVMLDNVLPATPIPGNFILSATTQTLMTTRILGTSETRTVPTQVLLTCNGNNLTISEDLVRRTLVCHLDAGVERPELREFGFEPVTEMKRRRPEMVVAAITLMRAYIVAGSPKQTRPLGSFEQWSRLVRDALVWVGEADPVECQADMKAADPIRDQQVAVIEHWWQVIGGKRVTARQVIEFAEENVAGFQAKLKNVDFHEALMTATRSRDQLRTPVLGKWLGSMDGRIVEGRRIVSSGKISGFQTYSMESVAAEGQSAEEAKTEAVETPGAKVDSSEQAPEKRGQPVSASYRAVDIDKVARSTKVDSKVRQLRDYEACMRKQRGETKTVWGGRIKSE